MLLAGKPRSGAALTAAVTGRLYCIVLFRGNNPLSLDSLSHYSRVCTGSPVPEAHTDSDVTVFGRFLKFLRADSPVSIDNYR